MLSIHIARCVKMRFCSHLRLLYLLELSLPLFQEIEIVAAYHFVDTHLFIFYVIVRPSLRLKSAFHALLNSILRMLSALVEPVSVMYFGFILILSQIVKVV